jgi:hypothetical protein
VATADDLGLTLHRSHGVALPPASAARQRGRSLGRESPALRGSRCIIDDPLRRSTRFATTGGHLRQFHFFCSVRPPWRTGKRLPACISLVGPDGAGPLHKF